MRARSEWLKWPLLFGKAIILVAFTIIMSPLALVFGVWNTFRGGADTSPSDLATILRGACAEGHPYWDELECVKLADPKLENIRQEALKISEPLTSEGRARLIGLAEEAEDLSHHAHGTARRSGASEAE